MLIIAGLLIASATGFIGAISADVLLAFWFSISAYVGGDQIAGVVASKRMPPGEKFSGNRKKLLIITVLLAILAAEAVILQARTGVSMPVQEMAAVLITCCGLVAAGEKTKTAFEGGECQQ